MLLTVTFQLIYYKLFLILHMYIQFQINFISTYLKLLLICSEINVIFYIPSYLGQSQNYLIDLRLLRSRVYTIVYDRFMSFRPLYSTIFQF